MRLRLAIVSLSAAASLAGVAYAEEPAATPSWYDQFTYSSGLSSARAGWSESEASAALDFAPSARWGVTLRMRDGEAAPVLGQPKQGDETSVRAYYQFTPRLRVGGEVSVAERATDSGTKASIASPNPTEQAQVKLESAFRF